MNNTYFGHCSVVILCRNEEHHIYSKQLDPRTTANEKVELAHCVEYITGAAEEEFVRDR